MAKEQKRSWIWIIVLLLILFLIAAIISSCIAFVSSSEPAKVGNIALIRIDGVITSSGDSGIFGEQSATADDIVSLIEKADQNDNIKAILFEINSPGGAAVASEEIANAVKKTNKTTVSYIRDVGASGAYWVASSTDHIFASRMSITGSVGVIASYLEFSGLMEHYNVTYERLVAGKYKDIGSPFKELTPVEKTLLQGQLDEIHQFFLDDVAENRHLTKAQVNEISSGIFFIGARAKELNLIDEIGGKDEAVSYIESNLQIKAQIAEYSREPSFFEMLSRLMNENSFFVGQGMASFLAKSPQAVQRVNVWA